MKHVVMFSGGAGSWAAAKRVAEEHGTDSLVLLFADTLIEDEDLYRFILEAAADIGGEFVRVADGRTPWQVFHDVRWMGNARIAQCSHLLKQAQCRKWITENAPDATLYVGIDWSEGNRMPAIVKGWAPWMVEAPLTEKPYLDKPTIIAALRAAGIEPPRLYAMGFPHNNCGGFCVRAGHGQFKHLLRVMPERYRKHEQQEEALRAHLGKDVSILRDRIGGKSKPLTLKALRERVEADPQTSSEDWGGCGCFTDEAA